MKRIFFLLVFVAAIAAWCTPSFAARQSVIADAQLDDDGELDGVDIADAVTLSVGVGGGPKLDIFTNNPLLNSVDPAVKVLGANDSSMVIFNVSSSVWGDMGQTTDGVLHLITANNGTTVDFLKSVYSTGLNVGTGRVNFMGGATSTNTVAMNFAGAGTTGTISLAPYTLVTGALITGTDNTGTLEFGNMSQLTGAVTGIHAIKVVGGDNTAGVSATITGAVDAYSFSLLTNTLNIDGALTLHDGSIINTTLASPSIYGHIVPTGAANLGATLDVDVTVPSTAYIPVGTLFNIVDATSGTDGSVVTVEVQDPTNPLYLFSAVPLAGTTNGLVQITTDQIPMQVSSNPVVPVLAALPVTVDLTDILGPLNALTDPAAIDDAVAQLAPSTPSLAAPLVTFQGIRRFQNLWLSRLDMCSQVSEPNENNSNCRDNEPRSGWWLKGFGYYGEQDARDAFTGYDSRILGTMIAYDAPLGLDTRAGLGFGYARSTIEGETFDADTDFDTYLAMAFLGHERGPWFVNGSASFGWNEYSSMRHIVFPGVNRTANAEYSGQDYTAFASTGLHFSAQELTITPLASLQYTRMHLSGYTEKDAGDINLKVKPQDYDFLESGLGVKVERYFSDDLGRTSFVPEIHFNWFHDLSNPELEQTAEFAVGSSSFTTPGLKTTDDLFNVGGGLTLLSCVCSATTWSLEAVYDYDWTNDGYSSDQVTMRLTYRF